MARFTDKVAIVTGGARGMGRTVSERLAAEGAKVIVGDIDFETAEKVASGITSLGGEALAVRADVSQSRDVNKVVDAAVRNFGKIEILINNAGILRRTRFDKIDEAEWDLVVAVNMKGVFLYSQAVYGIMKERGYGRIVNFSSTAGKTVSTLGGAHYTASKTAVLGITRALAKEAAPHGITVNAVCPGMIDTDMPRMTTDPEEFEAYKKGFPFARLGTSEEVVALVLFLASDEASYITGASIDINGGSLMI